MYIHSHIIIKYFLCTMNRIKNTHIIHILYHIKIAQLIVKRKSLLDGSGLLSYSGIVACCDLYHAYTALNHQLDWAHVCIHCLESNNPHTEKRIPPNAKESFNSITVDPPHNGHVWDQPFCPLKRLCVLIEGFFYIVSFIWSVLYR